MLDEIDRRALSVRTMRVFAVVIQSASWVLKSAGETKERPGMNEVSIHPLRRSTIPFDPASDATLAHTEAATPSSPP